MSQDIVTNIQDRLEPVSLITDISKSTFERLIALQTEYMTDLFNSGVAQLQTLCSVQEPKQMFEKQAKFFKELDAKFTNITEKEVALLSETKEQFMEIIEKNISGMPDIYGLTEATKLMQDAQEKFEQTINISAHKQNGGSNKTAKASKSV